MFIWVINVYMCRMYYECLDVLYMFIDIISVYMYYECLYVF